MDKNLGLLFKWVRILNGLSPYRVAKDLNIKWDTVMRFEADAEKSRTSTFIKLMQYYKIEYLEDKFFYQQQVLKTDGNQLVHGKSRISISEVKDHGRDARASTSSKEG